MGSTHRLLSSRPLPARPGKGGYAESGEAEDEDNSLDEEGTEGRGGGGGAPADDGGEAGGERGGRWAEMMTAERPTTLMRAAVGLRRHQRAAQNGHVWRYPHAYGHSRQ